MYDPTFQTMPEQFNLKGMNFTASDSIKVACDQGEGFERYIREETTH